MAEEILEELRQNGRKVIAEVARRDDQGRKIADTYSLKDHNHDSLYWKRTEKVLTSDTADKTYGILVTDTRSENPTPTECRANRANDGNIKHEFKQSNTIGLSNAPQFVVLETIIPWNDSSGGKVTQFAFGNGTIRARYEKDENTWEKRKLISAAEELITDLLYESDLKWGETDKKDSIGVVDAALSNLHSANRFAFANPDGIIVEYTNDGGNERKNYGLPDENKLKLVSGIGQSVYIGAKNDSAATVNDRLRITFVSDTMGVYTMLKKFLINIGTSGASNCTLTIEHSTIGEPDVFIEDKVASIAGWSGWNSINFPCRFGGSSTQASQYRKIRLTFKPGTVSETYNCNLSVIDIYAVGETFRTIPSTMAKTGHLYSYTYDQSASFPNTLTANSIISKTTISGSSLTVGNINITAGDNSSGLKTINGNSLFGSGSINLNDYYYTKDEVDNKVDNIDIGTPTIELNSLEAALTEEQIAILRNNAVVEFIISPLNASTVAYRTKSGDNLLFYGVLHYTEVTSINNDNNTYPTDYIVFLLKPDGTYEFNGAVPNIDFQIQGEVLYLQDTASVPGKINNGLSRSQLQTFLNLPENSKTLFESKLNISEENLATVDKTVVGAINELEGKFDNYATKKDLTDLINGAPENFDTLKEISDYLSTHENETAEIVADVAELSANKQDKLTTPQLDAVNSGITAGKLSQLNSSVNTLSTNVNNILPNMNLWRQNLGDPSLLEMALIGEEMTNKFSYFDTANILVEYGETEETLAETDKYSDLQLKRLVGGDDYAGIQLVNGYTRFTFTPSAYVFLNILYMYGSFNGVELIDGKIEFFANDARSTVVNYRGTNIFGRPSHCISRHNRLVYNMNTKVRITFHVISSDDKYASLDKLKRYGAYPAARSNLWTEKYNKNVIFPADVAATSFTENGIALTNKYAAKNHNHNDLYLPLSGGTLTGNLRINNATIIINGSTLDSLYAANNHNHDSTYLKLDGGNITGNLSVSGTITEGDTKLSDKYALKSEVSAENIVDLSSYDFSTITSIPVDVLAPIKEGIIAGKPPKVKLNLATLGTEIVTNNYLYVPDGSMIIINIQNIVKYDGETLFGTLMYTLMSACIAIDTVTGSVKNGNNITSEGTLTPSDPLQQINLATSDDLMALVLNMATAYAGKSQANTFTEIQTFSKGIKIGSTTLDETTINIPTVDVDFDTIIPVEQRTYLQRDTIKFKIPSLGIDSVVAHLLKHSSGNTRDYYFAMVDEDSNAVKTIVIRYDNSLIPQLIGNS